MTSGNSGNPLPDARPRSRERHANERDLDNSERLNNELQRLRNIADRMERNRRRGVLGHLAVNGVARSTFTGMLFMIIVMLTLHGFLRIFQNIYDTFF